MLKYENAHIVMTTYGNFRLFYDRRYFSNKEEARKHFDEHWRGDDEKMADEFAASGAAALEEFVSEGGAIRYKQFADDDRWHIFKRFATFDYTHLPAGMTAPSEDEVLVACPECGRTAYPLRPMYIHKVYSADGKDFAHEKCIDSAV
jgi:hypothetical protein